MNELEFFSKQKEKPRCLVCGCGFVWKGFNQDQCANPQCRNHAKATHEHLINVAWLKPNHPSRASELNLCTKLISLGRRGKFDLYYAEECRYKYIDGLMSILYPCIIALWERDELEIDEDEPQVQALSWYPFRSEIHANQEHREIFQEGVRRATLLKLRMAPEI